MSNERIRILEDQNVLNLERLEEHKSKEVIKEHRKDAKIEVRR